MALMQYPLLFDKEDLTLSAYLGNDFLGNQSSDILTPSFSPDDFLDPLINQLEAEQASFTIDDQIQSNVQLQNCQIPNADEKNSMNLQWLDELEFDSTPNSDFPLGQNSNSGSNLSPISDQEIDFNSNSNSNQGDDGADDGIYADEHDYAKITTKFPRNSNSYSSGDDVSSGSECRSPIGYDRQITSNSSSSSVIYEYSMTSRGALIGNADFSDDAETAPPRKQRRAIFNLPTIKKNTGPPSSSMESGRDRDGKRKYPPLILTEEERQICEKERIYLPDHYPLTRDEERKLKMVRRKIRNKASAQLSRKKKQEYMEALEHRATKCSEENEQLRRHVKILATKNNQLQAQLKRLEATLTNAGRRTAQTGTCLAVLLLSFALLVAPEYGPFGKRWGAKDQSTLANTDEINHSITPGNTRTLLQLRDTVTDADQPDPIDNPDPTLASFFNRFFYDNGSSEFEFTRKRKFEISVPNEHDDDAYFGKYVPERQFSSPVKKLKASDEKSDYKTPGYSNSNRSTNVNYQKPIKKIVIRQVEMK